MRVYVWKEKDGTREVLFRPGRRSGQPMVLLRGVARKDLKERVRGTLAEYSPSKP